MEFSTKGKVYKILDDNTEEFFCSCTVDGDSIFTGFHYDEKLDPENKYKVRWDGPPHQDVTTGEWKYYNE